MSRLSGWSVVAACAALAACGDEASPLPQWTVVLGTDAPVPRFGDRVLVEVLDDSGGACSGCRRQLSGAPADVWPLSFGVVPPADGGRLRVRARLYRTADTGYEGTPKSDRIIDTLVGLPATDGPMTVGIELAMRCFGVVADLDGDAGCDPGTGVLAPVSESPARVDISSLPRPGDWAPARTVECTGPMEDGMVCIPGGAFLMGAPQYLPLGDLDPVPEQIVQVSPFALDIDEMTVGAVRALVPVIGSPWLHGTGTLAECTFTSSPSADSSSERMPVNCVSRNYARAACKALGKRLPTEAEWEYAAGNLELESQYPWGSGKPCDHSVVGHGMATDERTSVECLSPGEAPGPKPVGTANDTTLLGVRDLGGNLEEWVEDNFRPFTDPACWGWQAIVHVDPLCSESGLPGIRGGNWAGQGFISRAALRDASVSDAPNRVMGFRCAK